MNIISADKQSGLNFAKFSNADQKKSVTESGNDVTHGSKSSGVAKKILAGVLGVSMLTGAITATLPTNTAEARGGGHHGGGHHGGGHHGGGHHGGGGAAFGFGLGLGLLNGLTVPRHYNPYYPPVYVPPQIFVPDFPPIYDRPCLPPVYFPPPPVFIPPQIFVPGGPCW